MPRLYVQRMGQAAHELLARGSSGQVLAVFSKAAYLVRAREALLKPGFLGELFWLTTTSAPMHRRCLQLSGSLPRLVAGSPFGVHDQCLAVGSEVLDFGRASLWQAPQLSPADVAALHTLPEQVRSVFAGCVELLSPKGFGQLIPGILDIARGCRTVDAPYGSTLIATMAWPAVRGIAQACLDRDIPRILEQAERLVGLGEGLTPSGDDFVGGLLFCGARLASVHPHREGPELDRFSALIKKFESSTNLISFTILKDHAAGHSIDTLGRFVNALLAGRPLETFYPLAQELAQVGHSSGWDMLAGVLAGMLLVFRAGEPLL